VGNENKDKPPSTSFPPDTIRSVQKSLSPVEESQPETSVKDSKISWDARVGKRAMLERLKQPRNALISVVALIMIGFLTQGLIQEITGNTEEPILKTLGTFFSLSFVFLLFLSVYLANRKLFKDKTRHYIIDAKGITVNGILNPWASYSFFLDAHSSIRKIASPILVPENPSVYIIDLLSNKLSDKNKLTLVIEEEEIYEKVLSVLREKLRKYNS